MTSSRFSHTHSLERLRRARESRDACLQRARHFGITLTTSDTGRLWTFLTEAGDPPRSVRAEWWPEKALLVFDGKYKKPIIAETTIDVFHELRERWTDIELHREGRG